MNILLDFLNTDAALIYNFHVSTIGFLLGIFSLILSAISLYNTFTVRSALKRQDAFRLYDSTYQDINLKYQFFRDRLVNSRKKQTRIYSDLHLLSCNVLNQYDLVLDDKERQIINHFVKMLESDNIDNRDLSIALDRLIPIFNKKENYNV
ncbi:MAG: hypothetical protein VB030_04465 [Eubacterium aggregans]|uniref:hypothetical protein n=1 Tax=Eubacterium aggregans TaxID=81409 RepID=UPI002B217AA4|nr:hypothetical protein [Eubacterium aggregans]MEA5073410.1 hypothetical protein [Eubacterium aggregans]